MAKLSEIKGGDKTAKKVKLQKVKLTKDQQRFLRNFTSLEYRIQVSQEITTLWTRLFAFFAGGDLPSKQFTPADEKAFLTLLTQIARRHFEFTELMGELFTEGKTMMSVLMASISLKHLQSQFENENARDKYAGDWHTVLIAMNKALGRLLRRLPGQMPLAQALGFMQWDAKQPKNEEKPVPLEKRIKAYRALIKDQEAANAAIVAAKAAPAEGKEKEDI